MAIKFSNLIVGDMVVGALEDTAPTKPVLAARPVIRETIPTDDAQPTDIKVSQYVTDMGVGNRINSLFDEE